MLKIPSLIAAAWLLGACEGAATAESAVANAVIAVDTARLAPDEHLLLSVALEEDDGTPVTGATITWGSSDTSIVRVDTMGMVVAGAPGTAVVTGGVPGSKDSVVAIVRRDWKLVTRRGGACALRSDNLLRCDGTTLAPPAGVQVVAMNGTAGQCVLVSGGAVWCRGSDAHGALGDGGSVGGTRDAFGPISGVADYAEVVGNGGDNFCARRTGGQVRCWGDDTFGELGNDTFLIDATSPVQIDSPAVFTSLATEAPDPYMCGTANGQVWCWGAGAADFTRRTPYTITPRLMLDRVSIGVDHSCALGFDRMAWCWGRNADGELGRGYTGAIDSTVVPAATPLGFFDILVAGHTTCGAERDGAVWCWGSGTEGQLGRPDLANSPFPIMIVSVETFVSVHVGGPGEICALTIGGAEYCWGGVTVGAGTTVDELRPRRTPSPF